VFSAPGRAGYLAEAEPVPLASLSPADILHTARDLSADLTVIGPEQPLVSGAADLLRREAMAVFGPGANAAMLEGSKEFAKQAMLEAGVPTGDFRSIRDRNDLDRALAEIGLPAAMKADGLAAGKGVVIVRHGREADEVFRSFVVDGSLGDAGRTLLLEEFLEGEELSLFALVDGDRYALFPTARDYKRIGDGGAGANTGGMGAIVPVPDWTEGRAAELGEVVFPPLLRELRRRGIRYQGILYAGLILTESGPRVLEFNCRFGDPETQALLPLVAEDLAERMLAMSRGEWIDGPIAMTGECATCLVLAAPGYPESAESGGVIEGLDAPKNPGIHVFHAGTEKRGDDWVVAGGRVLNVVATAEDGARARAAAYEAASKIRFPGVQLRTDIGLPGVRG
ncbi:MAG: phosphoribosylamine--glycine ligase, partial [Gemmatimonadetes bacterium]|nr:phosphoribosylamine--glycine ligase [Gemmatimonadota bacterium]